MIKAVIFDWSGVLSDDWEATFKAANDVLEEYGHKRLPMKEFRQLYELPWVNFYKKLGMSIDIKGEYSKWARIFPKYYHLVKPFPFAKKALEWVKQKGIKAIVLSSHNKVLLADEVKQYGFQGLIDAIDGSNEDKRKKIEHLAEEHEIEKASSLYVGDMCHDIETARLAGIRSAAVLSGYDTKEKLEREKPDFVIKDVGELPGLIEKLDGEAECAMEAEKSQ